MSCKISIRCTCGKLLKGELKGEGSLICPKCYRTYVRIYDQKSDTYIFI